jgi:Uma2 family endonuclease
MGTCGPQDFDAPHSDIRYSSNMAQTAAVIPVEEYLAHETKPASEYEDGVVRQKPMPMRKHGLLQQRIGQLIDAAAPSLECASEVTVQVRPGKFMVPDLIVQRRDAIQDPYPTEPVHLCIEVLSPTDRTSEAFAKCEEYHSWGVTFTWIVDPENRRAWQFVQGQRPADVPADGYLRAGELSIRLGDLFSVLDS